ncbi:hypothetical protein JOM56_009669 [Amanita muscaria]
MALLPRCALRRNVLFAESEFLAFCPSWLTSLGVLFTGRCKCSKFFSWLNNGYFLVSFFLYTLTFLALSVFAFLAVGFMLYFHSFRATT